MTGKIAFIDFETRSTVDLRRTGVEVYAAHPSTDVLCLCWAFDDLPVLSARRPRESGAELAPLFAHVAEGGTVVAHNARFELYLWRMMARRYGWPELRIEQLRCTMAAGRALSLPGSLGELAAALKLPIEKDFDGYRLMLKMCKPRKPRKNEPQDAIIWEERPEDLARLIAYCERDVDVERSIYNTLTPLSQEEQDLWELDQHINDRGISIDTPAVTNLIELTEREKKRLAREMRNLTGQEVLSAAQTAKLRAWFGANGLKLPDLRKRTVANALKLDVSPEIRRALELRQDATKASTAKLKAMTRGAGHDNRARGLLEYHGAGTGRWAGRRVQPQNMTRTPDEFHVEDAENIFEWARCPRGELGIALEYGTAMTGVSLSLRSLLVAGPRKRLLSADYVNIEGRVLAWLAGEAWKLDAFRQADEGIGHELYVLTYSKSFGVPVEDVTKPQRQIGKVQELALGYQGGHGAFISMGANYNVDLDEIARAVEAAVTPSAWAEAKAQYWRGAEELAEEFLADMRAELEIEAEDDEDLELEMIGELVKAERYGLSVDTWAALRLIVDGWRDAHPATVSFWRTLADAARDAVENPGKVVQAGLHIHYKKSGDFLYCRLPGGRVIAYPYARMETTNDARTKRESRRVVFEGVNSRTRKWGKESVYGGLLAENVTQATARDILADALKRLDRAGYPTVLHVHDEAVAEVDASDATKTLADFNRIMAACEPWADGLPVTVSGWEGLRYRK